MTVTEAGNPIYNKEVCGRGLVLEAVEARAQVGACHFPALSLQSLPWESIAWKPNFLYIYICRSCVYLVSIEVRRCYWIPWVYRGL